jgi:hypothetical protein
LEGTNSVFLDKLQRELERVQVDIFWLGLEKKHAEDMDEIKE